MLYLSTFLKFDSVEIPTIICGNTRSFDSACKPSPTRTNSISLSTCLDMAKDCYGCRNITFNDNSSKSF